jgi:hypothetical protein
VSFTCAVVLALSATIAAGEPAAPLLSVSSALASTALPAAPAQRALLSAPTLLLSRGLSGSDLPVYDSFMQRAFTQKRLELVRFVDHDDRRVFLGLSRDGYLGIQVQTRDRR